MINNIDIFYVFTYILSTTLLAGIVAFPIIGILYKFKIVRHFDVDFSALIETRKQKIGTPIMGGLIFILPIALINLIFNFTAYTALPLIVFTASSILGGTDDILNIYGTPRKIRTLSRIRKLISVHKNKFIRLRFVLSYPWYVYARLAHIFESNPGKGLFAHEKLLLQTLMAIAFGIWLQNGPVAANSQIWFPLIGNVFVGVLFIPFVVFVFLAMTNAVNVSDGMDGLASGMLAPMFGGFMLIALLEGNLPIVLLCGSVLGGLLTYLYFNVAPARVQMGDIGSFALGGLAAIVAFSLNKPVLLAIMGLPFVIEIASVVLQSISRRVFGRRLLSMAPLHHHFELKGWSEEKVVMRFWLFSMASCMFGLWVYFL